MTYTLTRYFQGFSAGCAFIGIFFVPFLRIGTQGHKGDTGRVKGGEKSGLGLDDGHVAVAVNEKREELDVEGGRQEQMKS